MKYLILLFPFVIIGAFGTVIWWWSFLSSSDMSLEMQAFLAVGLPIFIVLLVGSLITVFL